jgi:hypothetical protein
MDTLASMHVRSEAEYKNRESLDWNS